MLRTLALACVAALVSSCAPDAVRAQEPSPLSAAAWLSGCWELRSGQRVTLEMWMPASGDMMLGASRTQVAGVTRKFEHLRLSAEAGALVYTASPSRQSTASFTSVHASDTALVVENLQHDPPQGILYGPLGRDSLVARIEGPGREGPRGIDFPMRRVSCQWGPADPGDRALPFTTSTRSSHHPPSW